MLLTQNVLIIGFFLSLLVYESYVPVTSDILITETAYTLLKKDIKATKSASRNQQLDHDALSSIMTDFLVNKIIPHWIGTPWSFDGHTSVPRQGEISCGYFVSTTLKDVGFNLNRYKLAQQLPINEGKTLSLGEPLIEIYNTSTEGRIQTLKDSLSEGIYFIGFDRSHVGFVHKKNRELFVVHSNYIGHRGVEIEKIEDSAVFSRYSRIYIAAISTNKALLRKWKNNNVIDIKTE